jgi:hypothetical protein
MILFLGAGVIYLARVSYSRTIKWDDNLIVIARRFGETTSHSWRTVRGVSTNSFTGEHIIVFESGEKLRIPTMMKGANQLAQQLQSRGFR